MREIALKRDKFCFSFEIMSLEQLNKIKDELHEEAKKDSFQMGLLIGMVIGLMFCIIMLLIGEVYIYCQSNEITIFDYINL